MIQFPEDSPNQFQDQQIAQDIVFLKFYTGRMKILNNATSLLPNKDLPKYIKWQFNKLSQKQRFQIQHGIKSVSKMFQNKKPQVQTFLQESSYCKDDTIKKKRKNENFNIQKTIKRTFENKKQDFQQNQDQKQCLNMQEQISAMSQPLTKLKLESNRKKWYYCQYCNNFQHYGRPQILKHKKICKKRTQIKQIKKSQCQRQKDLQNLIKQIQVNKPENIKQNQQKMINEKQQFSQIRKDIKQLQNYIFQVVDRQKLSLHHARLKQQQVVSQIMTKISSAVIQSVTINLSQAVQNAINSNINLLDLKNNIAHNIISRINQIDYNQVIFSFPQKLNQAYQHVLKQCAQMDNRTKQDNEKAYLWLSKYKQFHFYNQVLILNDISKQSLNKQKNIRRFYQKLKKYSPYFGKMPNFPPIVSGAAWKKIRPIINMQQIVNEVVQLLNSKNKDLIVLAVDIWMVTCIGLRSTDLTRVYFSAKNKQIVHSIKLLQNKNKKISVRYVPQSLAVLIQKLNISYPITFSRLSEARKFCLQKFHTFYGARHLLILTILTALSQTSMYASFHRSMKTTIQHYLTGEQSALIDASFKLPIEYQGIENIKKRSIMLDLVGNLPIERQTTQISVTLQSILDFSVQQIAQKDSLLSGQVSIKDILQSKIQNQLQKQRLISTKIVYQTAQKQLLESQGRIQSYDQSIIKMAEEQDVFQDILYREMELQGMSNQEESLSRVIHEISGSNMKIIKYDIDTGSSFVKQYKFDKAQNTFFIAENIKSKKYQPIQQQKIKLRPDRKAKYQAMLKNKIILDKNARLQRKPLLCFCKANYVSTIDDSSNILKCLKCQKKFQSKVENLKTFKVDSYQIITEITSLFYVESIKKGKAKNNFLETIQNIYGTGSYISNGQYSQQIPKILYTTYPSFSKEQQNQINYNRTNQFYLNLEIKKSSIPEGGFGIFAKQQIKKLKLILTYVGVIKSTFSVDLKNDSLFTLGWINSEKFKAEVLIQPKDKLNSARFINGADEKFLKNCQTTIGILNNREIVLMIYSIKTIKKGDQLFYEYGNLYFGQKEINDQQDQS